MNREKAIEYLEWVRPKKPYTQDKKNVQTAIDMGIEALKETERNPTVTSWHDFDRGYNIAKEKFNRPHGEWLPKYDDNGGRRYVCSICGEPCYTLLWTEPKPRDRFCLWCGADMREGDERSE